MLNVKPIRTSPYHPQTDGLVERFNITLKSMLRKLADDEGKEWDSLLPYVLFAYREVPQASTGFSPFELVYGRAVRHPLDILKESWQASKQSSENVVSYVLNGPQGYGFRVSGRIVANDKNEPVTGSTARKRPHNVHGYSLKRSSTTGRGTKGARILLPGAVF